MELCRLVIDSRGMSVRLLKEMFVEYYYTNMAYYPDEIQNLYGENSILSFYDIQNSVGT